MESAISITPGGSGSNQDVVVLFVSSVSLPAGKTAKVPYWKGKKGDHQSIFSGIQGAGALAVS